ncbi:hypothetical protein [Arthrobacter echini]|nr:hypothetical protein [Arthrobacter echini]
MHHRAGRPFAGRWGDGTTTTTAAAAGDHTSSTADDATARRDHRPF